MPYKTYEELLAEAASQPPPPTPGFQPYNPLWRQPKSEERRTADAQRLYVLDRLKEVQSGAPEILDQGPLRQQLASPFEAYAKPGFSYRDKDSGEVKAVPGQYLGEESPIWKGLTWLGSPVSAIANASRELANQADRGVSYMYGQEPVEHYPGAWENFGNDVGTFASALPGPVASKNTRWQELRDMREAQDSVSADQVDPRAAERFIQEGLYGSRQIDNVDLLEGNPLLPSWGPMALGTLMNITTDPNAAMLSVGKLVKQGRKLAAWGALGSDVATSAVPELIMQNPELVKQIRDAGVDVTDKIRDLLPNKY